MGSLAFISADERLLALDIQSLANRLVRLDISKPSRILACVMAQSSLLGWIKTYQYDDPHLLVLRETVLQGGAKEVTIGEDGVLRLHGRLCVPNIDGLREKILEEAHSSRYSIHLGATEMYRDLRQHYWWWRMKKDIVEYVKLIQERLRTAQSRQKRYTDQKACDLSFMVGEKVLLKVLPMKGIMRLGKKGKLSPKFNYPFEVLWRVGEVAYELTLPPSLSGVHQVLHVSMLQRYHVDRSHMLDYNTVKIDESLGYEEEPVAIVDRKIQNPLAGFTHENL
ncbi:uncharacterized protein [Nicotiana tomentosiformis]|uniref:uncharacterized protein n=1 Tax=Nicotiana tomentosiformis TaxID=4098 RepID=UPI00388CE05B